MNHLTRMEKNQIGIGKNPVRRSKMRNNPFANKKYRHSLSSCRLRFENEQS